MNQEESEDYGYDLAHEVPTGPDERHPHRARQGLRGQAPRPADADTDYSSDEAHDL